MARTPYADPDAEAAYQDVVSQSSQPSAMPDGNAPATGDTRTDQRNIDFKYQNGGDNNDVNPRAPMKADWERGQDAKDQRQRNKRRGN